MKTPEISESMFLINQDTQDVQDVVKSVAVVEPMCADSGHGVETVRIYVENHDNECKELFV